MIKPVLKIILLASLLCACSNEPKIDEQLLGNWRTQQRHIHTILTFRANGSWQWEQKIEGQFSKIIEKKQEVEGEWAVSEGRLCMTPAESNPEAGWEKGKMVLFEIAEINQKSLKLITADGKTNLLQRVRSKKNQDDDMEEGTTILSLGPLIVNLSKEGSRSRDRFLCVDMELVLASSEFSSPEALRKVHPRIREVILFHLSSQHYRDVKTFDKLKVVKDELFEILTPYFKEELKELNINRVMITASKEKVEWFLSEPSEHQ
jgi:flagellar basal body-associated protein FliL